MNQSRRILITGATGFVGGGLAEYFSPRGWAVIGSGRKPAGPTPEYYEADLSRDAEAAHRLLDQSRPEVVIHCAGVKDLRWCESHAEEARRINALASGWLAAAAQKRGAQFLLLSTDLVFSALRGNYQEEDRPDSEFVYGKTKAEAEALVRESAPSALVCRTGGVFGARSPLFRWLGGELRKGNAVEAFLDVKNCPTYLPELGALLEGLLQKRETGLFHTGGHERLSRYEWFRAFASAAKLNPELVRTGQAEGRHRELLLFPDSSLNVEKVQRATGLRTRSVAEAFAEMAAQEGL